MIGALIKKHLILNEVNKVFYKLLKNVENIQSVSKKL